MSEQEAKRALTKSEGSSSLQTYGGHLKQLRRALLISIAAIFVAFFVILNFFTSPLITFLLRPIVSRGVIVVATGVTESFMMQVKTSLVAGIIASFPIIVWQIGGFVWPALYGEEKKRFVLSFLALVFLFVSGIVFAYVAVFPLAVNLFYESGLGHARAMWSINGYFNFVLSFLLPFGLMFELPVIIYLLARAGKVTNRSMNRARRYFILGATVAAAFLTPPDVVSQIFLLIPLIALYEVSALLARLVKPKHAENEE